MADTLGGSFKAVLTDIAKGKEQIAIYDYCDEDDFPWLWTLGYPEFHEFLPENKHIIIVWDGRGWGDMRHQSLLSPHLTPMDWALAFSIKILCSKPEADISIHIVDLTGTEDDKKWAMQMRHQLLVEMPWVKLYTPLIPEEDGKQERIRQGYNPIIAPASSHDVSPPLIKKQNGGGLCLNLSGETLKDAKTSDSRNRLIDLAKQWSASLIQSKDHHDINNVIGSSLLDEASRTVEDLRSAFHNRLLWCDFNLREADINEWSPDNEEARFNEPLSVLMVDDHLMEGWGKFVCQLLTMKFKSQHDCNSDFKKISKGNSEKMNIYGCTGPDPLIKFLETAKFACRDFAQQVPCGENGDKISPQVILLDLRLPDLTKEKVTKLLCVKKKLPQKGLAWPENPEIEKKEAESIKNWCNGESNDDQAADKALLLLPRLLAMALPLTPIILFSATGQTWIKEMLKPYQNIFTGFEKPRVLSNPEAVENSIAALHEGLDKAVKMMRLRLQLAHAQKAVDEAKDARPKKDKRICNHHVEIYADETEIGNNNDKDIVSGLAVCVFEDRRAEQLQSKLECEHREGNGVVWAKNKGKPDKTPELKKGSDIKAKKRQNQQVNLVCRLLSDLSINRLNWSVVATSCEISNSNTVSLASFPDAALDAALRFNLEFSLFVLIPYLSKNEFQRTIEIHLPTRVLPTTNALKEFAKAFSLSIDPHRKIVDIWPLDSGFPLVRGWLAGWGDNGAPLSLEKVKRLKMTSLGRGTDTGISEGNAKERRLFHDIADWVCTAIRHQSFRGVLTEKKIFRHWFVNREDTKNALVLMDALRASSNSENNEQDNDTLRLLLRNTYIRDCNDWLLTSEFCSQQRLILWALRDKLNHGTGPGLHRLCV